MPTHQRRGHIRNGKKVAPTTVRTKGPSPSEANMVPDISPAVSPIGDDETLCPAWAQNEPYSEVRSKLEGRARQVQQSMENTKRLLSQMQEAVDGLKRQTEMDRENFGEPVTLQNNGDVTYGKSFYGSSQRNESYALDEHRELIGTFTRNATGENVEVSEELQEWDFPHMVDDRQRYVDSISKRLEELDILEGQGFPSSARRIPKFGSFGTGRPDWIEDAPDGRPNVWVEDNGTYRRATSISRKQDDGQPYSHSPTPDIHFGGQQVNMHDCQIVVVPLHAIRD